jgi:hypothetical protein
MMIEEVVYSIGTAAAGLTALIGAGSAARLFPVAEEQEHALPRLIYEKDTPRPIAGIWSDSGWYKTHIRFRAYGQTAMAAKQVIEQVRAAYQRYHGQVSTIWVEDVKATGWGSDDYDIDLAQFWEEVEFEFFYK